MKMDVQVAMFDTMVHGGASVAILDPNRVIVVRGPYRRGGGGGSCWGWVFEQVAPHAMVPCNGVTN